MTSAESGPEPRMNFGQFANHVNSFHLLDFCYPASSIAMLGNELTLRNIILISEVLKLIGNAY